MKLLKRIILALVILLIMKGLILLLDKYSPATHFFHRQFLFCLQLAVISWVLIVFSLFLFKKENSWFAKFLPVFLILLVIVADMIYNHLLQHPEKIPKTAVKSFGEFYTSYERNIIQYEPCSVYDSSLFYKLIPGLSFTFGNIEYSNQYNINSSSFRDDEKSLFGPEIVCVGDSYTLGWGVEGDETYPQLLEKKTGINVLNAGNSSYGTARELKQLVNADTSVMKYLVIQYCRNDAYENGEFVKYNGVLPVSPAQDYLLAHQQYTWAKEYFPGKYFLSISYHWMRGELRNLVKGTRIPHYLTLDRGSEARDFLEVLSSIDTASKFRLIVFDLEGPGEMNGRFINAVDSLMQDQKYANLRERLTTLDLSHDLNDSNYFRLDTHLNASGHVVVADKIATIISAFESSQEKKD